MAKPPSQSKNQHKKARREEARRAREKARRRARRRRQLQRGGAAAAAALVLAGVAGAVYLSGSERRAAQGRLGDMVALEDTRGRAHTAVTTAEPAPTSGPHLEGPVCGVQRVPVAPGAQIHALEHGAVAFQYHPDELTPDDVSSLEALGGELGDHVLVAPNPSLGAPVMATAWTRRMALDDFDASMLRDFATAFRNRGPESAPCSA